MNASKTGQSLQRQWNLTLFWKDAERDHGVRHMRVIGDGDSSVYAKIQSQVPVWGRDVAKLECSNQSCKCLRSNLEKLVEEKPHYKGRGKLTKLVRLRLVSVVRCAIKMRSADKDHTKGARLLRHNILNSVYHVFGSHKHCSDFCKTRPNPQQPNDNDSQCEPENNTTTDFNVEVMSDQTTMWTEGMADTDMESARFATSSDVQIDPNLLQDVLFYLNRLAAKSERLIGNFTTNLAEGLMAVRCKFDGGKYFNRCFRGSWSARCFGGGLRKDFGPAWSPFVWNKVTGLRPGCAFTALYHNRSKKLINSLKSQSKPENKAKRLKRKMEAAAQSNKKKAKTEYGPGVLDDSQTKNIMLKDAAKLKSFCLQICDNKLTLKRQHKFYYQCQGQLNILDQPWLDFVIRTTNPYDFHVERIHKDPMLWNNDMVPKLTAFYEKPLLPELAVPRYGTTTGIREPLLPWYVPGNDRKKTVKPRNVYVSKHTKNQHHPRAQCIHSSDTCKTVQPAGSSDIDTPTPTCRRSSRDKCFKFVGRRINHHYVVNEKTVWFKGTVLQVISGKDGHKDTVYEVKYDKENASCELSDLQQDFNEGSLKFIDLN